MDRFAALIFINHHHHHTTFFAAAAAAQGVGSLRQRGVVSLLGLGLGPGVGAVGGVAGGGARDVDTRVNAVLGVGPGTEGGDLIIPGTTVSTKLFTFNL